MLCCIYCVSVTLGQNEWVKERYNKKELAMATRDDMDDNADKKPEEQLQQDLDRAREALQAATPTEETPALNLELEDEDDQPAHPNLQQGQHD